jgi:hypothetical protein
LKRLIRYLKGTRTKGIIYGAQPNPGTTDDDACHIKGYTDSDWAGDISTCKSTSGYLFLGAEALIAWGSNKQPIVALSICEAEYVAASDITREAISLGLAFNCFIGTTYTSWRVTPDWFSYSHHRAFVSL